MRVSKEERGIYDIYKYYKERVSNPLSFVLFRDIIFRYNKKLANEIIVEGSNVRIPNRLGYIRVKKSKMDYNNLKFDYGTYNKTGIKAFHLNEHSDDYKARILWNKSKCIVKGKSPWRFTPSRDNKRLLSNMMKTNHNIYLEDINIK